MSNNFSINTSRVSRNYNEARDALKEALSILANHGLSWSDNFEGDDLMIFTGTVVTLIPLLVSLFRYFIQKDEQRSQKYIVVKFVKFSLASFLLSSVIFNKSFVSSIKNICNSSKRMILSIPGNLFLETENEITKNFNSVIENSANINKDSLSALVANVLIENIIKNEEL